ncbi:MAG: pyruvate kinase [Patescibacteria group bacterium]|jgi:pyruvate kinase
MPNDKRTKIIATIGPATETKSSIEQMIRGGVDVFRFNMKHGTYIWHQETIRRVQEVADSMDRSIGILIDLQGPEIRLQTRDSKDVVLKKGQEIVFCEKFRQEKDIVRVPHGSFFKALTADDKFSADDGFVRFEVVKRLPYSRLLVRALDDAILKDRKSINLVGKDIDLPSLIKEDIARLSVATKEKVDFVALSFVRSRKDVETLRRVMEKKHIEAQIVSKIESRRGLDNIEEIIEVSDAIMVARGDLGIEVPFEEVTFHQKQIINLCRKAYKPVIVATQMLQSMIENPLPTRAEANDVANAVFDGTDAVMLSGETATGKYPLQSIEAMEKILEFNEKKALVTQFNIVPEDPTELIVQAAEEIAESSARIDKIVVFTETGHTARVISSFRPKTPLIVVTHSQKTVETVTLSYGAIPVKLNLPSSGKMLSPEVAIAQLKEKGIVKKGENALMIHGQHWRKPGQTNAIVLITVD